MRPRLAELDDGRFDVIVIGGGINGASTAQHLAAAGYSALIVDKGDFGSGASSRSSRLLHCGLRYLAPGRSILDFVRHPKRLVVALRMARLAMQARSEFARTSPHRTHAMMLHFPVYRDGPYAAWQIRAAFGLLKRLGGNETPLDYRWMSPQEARAHPLIGGLRDLDRLVGVAAFREFQFNWPEKIVLDAVLDAERMGAAARNYTEARLSGFARDSGWTVELTDVLAPGAPVRVRGSIVLMMSGVWIDEVVHGVNPSAGRKIFGTKGCHLLVKLPEACAGAGIATLNSRHEPLYCIPWKQYHYFGPTETAYEGDPDRVFVTAEEANGIIADANVLLPGLRLTPADIRMSWAGVRPLTFDPAVPFGNRSRVIHDLAADGLPSAFALTAGPVMTHRSAARELTGLVAQRLAPSHPPQMPNYAPPAERRGAEHTASLSDELFRRRGTAWSGPVEAEDLNSAASELGAILAWDETRMADEVHRFEAEWNDWYASPYARQERMVHGRPKVTTTGTHQDA
jgi:glycerol-3-phosphate dehydrogenase